MKRKPRNLIKNKQEMDSTSGVKKQVEKKAKIKFEFVLPNGKIVKNGEGRLKISTEGGISFYTQEEGGWKAQKGCKLLSFKLIYERPKLLGNVGRVRRKSTRK